MITEIGALVSIVNGLTDIAKSGADLFGKRKKAVTALKARVAGLAAQLSETATLMTYVPTWVRQCDQILAPRADLPADEIQKQNGQLYTLISESRYDYFSGAIYRTTYDTLPGMSDPMDEFRKLLERLETSNNEIRFDVALPALQKDWATVQIRLRDLRRQAEAIKEHANELHGRLINELKQAGAE